MEDYNWKVPLTAASKCRSLTDAGYTPLLSSILDARGISTPDKAKNYLSRGEDLLHDPMTLKDMDKAVCRIEQAMQNNERVAVYGDYDVDGITSSCLVFEYLSKKGLDCIIYIPDRIDEGYGINSEALLSIKEKGVTLIITVDCGITAVSEVEYAKSLGMDIIITDHHECPKKLPDAVAVIDPKRSDSSYPFDALAGVGVAFKLVCALEKDTQSVLNFCCDLVSVGTVADIMPLTGENRVLVQRGLEKLRDYPRPGFAALLNQSGASGKALSVSTISFTLAPRINAAGRLCQTQTSVRLLLTQDEEEAENCATELCELNRRRQSLESLVWDDATEYLTANPPKSPIVLYSDSWHPGIVGIAASRLAEEYNLPTIVICLDGDMGKGSCRSFGSFNLFDAFLSCSDHLESFGGHAFAAGLNIKKDNIEAFSEALAEYYVNNPPPDQPSLEAELMISDLSMLDMVGVSSLDELEPCGSGNPKPLMYIENARLESLASIGKGKHLRLRVSKDGFSFDGVFFSHSPEDLDVCEGSVVDLCFIPQINVFNGRRSIQFLLSGIRCSNMHKKLLSIFSDETISIDELEKFRPTREELVGVWRAITQNSGCIEIDLTDTQSSGLGEMEPIMLCLCLKIFEELRLLSVDLRDGHLNARIICGAEKNALENSTLFRMLWHKNELEV